MALAVKAERIVGPRAVVGIRRRAVEVSTRAFEPQYQRYFRSMLGAATKLSEREGLALGARYLRAAGAEEPLKRILDAQYTAMTQTVWEDVVGVQVGKALNFDLNARGVERILDKVGTRVTGITDASQRMIAQRVESEIARGSNADVLEKSLQDLLRSWGEDGGRAHIIALTESGNAYNAAAIEGYRETGLVEMVQVYDGPDCGWTEHDDPDLADGSTRTLEEADEWPLSHPHCQRAFGPVVLTGEEPEPAPAPASEEGIPEPETEPVPAPDEVPLEPTPEPPMPEVVVGEGEGLPDDVTRHLDEWSEKILQGDSPPTESSSWGTYQPDPGRMREGWEAIASATGQTFDDVIREAEFVLQETADDLILSTRRSASSVRNILTEGRFKSQFETGRSGGALAPEHRAAAEKYMFGYKKALPVEERPIYGYLRDPNRVDGASWYGDVLMDLKTRVRQRTTVVWNDSLQSTPQPSPLTRIRASSFDPGKPGSSYRPVEMPKLGRTGNPYTEAQMHGGLGADDIARVELLDDSDRLLIRDLEQNGFVRTPGTNVWESTTP